MQLGHLHAKDGLVLCTVLILFLYFAIVIWTNYEILIPFWTPIFWAAALSVPLHALKRQLYSSLYNLLEHDIMDIVAYTLGGAVLLVIRFFFGGYVASGVKFVFKGYCHIMNIVIGGHTKRKPKASPEKPAMPYGEDYYLFQQSLLPGNENAYIKRRKSKNKPYTKSEEQEEVNRRGLHLADEDGDYELHSHYQQLVDQVQDKYPAKPTWPSYMMLARLAFAYCLLQVATPTELYQYARNFIYSVKFGTVDQLWFILGAFMAHAVIISVGDWITMVEMLFNPGLDHIQMAKRSFRTLASRAFRKSIQQNLHSSLSLWLSLLTVSVLGLFSVVLSVGVVHDIQGVLAQTHARVTKLQQDPQLMAGKKGLVTDVDQGLASAYSSGLQWLEPIVKDAFPLVGWTPLEWATQISNIVVVQDCCDTFSAYSFKADDLCLKPLVQHVFETTPFWLSEQEYNGTSSGTTADSPAGEDGEDAESFRASSIPAPESPPTLFYVPLSWKAIKAKLAGSPSSSRSPSVASFISGRESATAVNLSQIQYLINVLKTYNGLDTETLVAQFNWFNDFLFRCILFMLTLTTLTGVKVSPLQRIGWLIDQALASSTSISSLRLSRSASPGRLLVKHLEYAISGTFFAMFKLSVYHTIFTILWTHHVSRWATHGFSLTYKHHHISFVDDNSDSDFVPVKYAWLTSLAMVVLTIFPIAPSWVASIPGAIIHFYIYGKQRLLALLLVLGHLVMTLFVDGPVWDTYIVKSAQPGTSSAFWLGLWVYLGGMRWGPKGLLLGPVLYAAVPSIWAAILEMRGRPGDDDHQSLETLIVKHSRRSNSSKKAIMLGSSKTNGDANHHSSTSPSKKKHHRHRKDSDSESASSASDSCSNDSDGSECDSDSEGSLYEVRRKHAHRSLHQL